VRTRPLTHDDYADKADSAERAEAWPHASLLRIRNAEVEQRNSYLDSAAKCDREVEIDKLLTGLAKRELRVPTLAERTSDSLDLHEVGVRFLRGSFPHRARLDVVRIIVLRHRPTKISSSARQQRPAYTKSLTWISVD
jgi:hypothetical protein